MKDEDFIHIDWDLVNKTTEIPFHITFSYENEFTTIQLVNGKDIIKLAYLFADMLTENGIDFNIIKTKDK